MRSGSVLERMLLSGTFTVTAELQAPDSAEAHVVLDNARVFENTVDAINCTDGSGANCHMSSVAMAVILRQGGYDAVAQISCRDRNRIAVQGDMLGLAALGVKNMLCITGDGVQAGDHPGAKPVFDLDAISLLQTAKIVRDQGHYLSGRSIEHPPKMFLGAAANPFVPPFEFRPQRLRKKIEAGAEFIQTQFCYDIPRLRKFMSAVTDMGLHERAHILVGVGPLRSARAAEWIRRNVPGIHIPDEVINRLRDAGKKARTEGNRICAEIIQQVREIDGIKGVHVMAYRQEEMVPEILKDAGLLPRPVLVDAPEPAMSGNR